ncbi:hypothetical protein I3U61_24110 [Mycobacteroides abscessus subsp. massiliense]|nr:hypothetical protein [Mycobacteroides abscessus]MBN7567093.1 hypothetical protein [Mycobacteroides abscessus subsp. massiliense]
MGTKTIADPLEALLAEELAGHTEQSVELAASLSAAIRSRFHLAETTIVGDEVNRQLNQRVIELRADIEQWGEKAEWALQQDDTGWWGDVLEGFVKRGKRMKETGR